MMYDTVFSVPDRQDTGPLSRSQNPLGHMPPVSNPLDGRRTLSSAEHSRGEPGSPTQPRLENSTDAPSSNTIVIPDEKVGCFGRLLHYLSVLIFDWHLVYLIIFLGVGATLLILLILDAAVWRGRREVQVYASLVKQIAVTSTDVASVCSDSIRTNPGAPVDSPGSVDSLAKLIKSNKHHSGELMEYVYTTLDALHAADCPKALMMLNSILRVSQYMREGHGYKEISTLSSSWLLAWSQLRSEGLTRLDEDRPVASLRAMKGASMNLVCSPILSNFAYASIPQVSSIIRCDNDSNQILFDNAEVFLDRSIVVFDINTISGFLLTLREWAEMFSSSASNAAHIVHIALELMGIICCVGGFIVMCVTSVRMRNTNKVQSIIEKDFLVKNGEVRVKEEALRMLDFYCWKVGSMEYASVTSASSAAHQRTEEAARTASWRCFLDGDEADAVDAPWRNHTMEDDRGKVLETTATRLTTSKAAPSGDVDDTEGKHRVNDDDQYIVPGSPSMEMGLGQEEYGLPPSLHPLVRQRAQQLRSYYIEGARLENKSQLQMYMHQAVYPALLIRPFVPNYMMTSAHYEGRAVANLGPSIQRKHTMIVMQDGLVMDTATYLFVSFHSFNNKESLRVATHHYGQHRRSKSQTPHGKRLALHTDEESSHSSEDTAADVSSEALIMTHKEDPKPIMDASHDVIISEGARLTDGVKEIIYQPPTLDLNKQGGRRLLQDTEAVNMSNAANADGTSLSNFPLSPLAAGVNIVLGCIHTACTVYRGLLVQVSSEGALIQFRAGTEKDEMQCRLGPAAQRDVALTSADDADGRNEANKGDSITVEGKTYFQLPEERAVRAAFLIRSSLDDYRDMATGRAISFEMLQCPMIVLSDDACLRGRVEFHVSRSYAVLSKVIPLSFLLESICRSLEAKVLVTQSVHDAIERMAITRPVHYLNHVNLNCYHYMVSRRESTVAATSESVASNKISLNDSHLGGNVNQLANTEAVVPAAASTDEDLPPNSSPIPPSPLSADSFVIAGTVYDVHQMHPLNRDSEEYRIFCDMEVRSRLRREHWRDVWHMYENILNIKGDEPRFKNIISAKLRGGERSHLSATSRPMGQMQSIPITNASIATQQETSGRTHAGRYLEARHEGAAADVDVAASMTDVALLTDILHACDRELQAYKAFYDVPSKEAALFNMVREDVRSTLVLLGEGNKSGDEGVHSEP